MENDENIKSVDKNENMLDTDHHLRDMDTDVVPKPNNVHVVVVVFDQGYDKCKAEKMNNIPKLNHFFSRWTSNGPAFKLPKAVHSESFEDIFGQEPEITIHDSFVWD